MDGSDSFELIDIKAANNSIGKMWICMFSLDQAECDTVSQTTSAWASFDTVPFCYFTF